MYITAIKGAANSLAPPPLKLAARKVKFLTPEFERELIRRWQSRGDYQARDELVLKFQPLVRRIAAKYRSASLEPEDLVSEGNLGLLRALDKFDLDKGTRFSTYAAYWIRALVSKATKQAQSVLPDASLNELTFDSDGNSVEKITLLPDGSANPRLENRHAERLEAIRLIVGRLGARERRILEARYFTDKPATLKELGAELGITGERARQIEKAALNKIRAEVEKRDAADFARAMTVEAFNSHPNTSQTVAVLLDRHFEERRIRRRILAAGGRR